MSSPLRRPLRPQLRKIAPFADPSYGDKQQTREMVARVIAKYFTAPTVFVLPSYEALCAKTINSHVPNAIFYGADYYRSVVEKTDSINDAGKTIEMQHKSVARYIRDNARSLHFDAAFLDYKTMYRSKRREIQNFAVKMLKPQSVLAVTAQRGNLVDAAQTILEDLRAVASSVVLEDSLDYATTIPMICAIFHIKN